MTYVLFYDNFEDADAMDGATVAVIGDLVPLEPTWMRREMPPTPMPRVTFNETGPGPIPDVVETAYRLRHITTSTDGQDTVRNAIYVRSPPEVVRFIHPEYPIQVGDQVIQSAHPEYVLLASRHPRDEIVGRVRRVSPGVHRQYPMSAVTRVHLDISPAARVDTRQPVRAR